MKHTELIAWLEAAEVGSRELDIKLALDTEHPYGFDTSEDEDDCPRYTASLGAALELVERVLPGWEWDVARSANGLYRAAFYKHKSWKMAVAADVPTPALALCIAILRALDANN